VLFGAVIVPGLFVLVWLLWWGKVIEQPEVITWANISGVGALISVVITVLNYRRELRKDTLAREAALQVPKRVAKLPSHRRWG